MLAEFADGLDWIGKLNDALQYLEKLPKVGDTVKLPAAYGSAATEVATLATSLGDLYKNFRITLPASPNITALQTHLDLLQADEDHIATLGMIAARRDAETGDTLTVIDETRTELQNVRQAASTDDIAASMTKAVADARAAAGAVQAKAARDLVG